MKSKLSKIALCLPLLMLDIEPSSNSENGWEWQVQFSTASAKACNPANNQGCHTVIGTRPDPWWDEEEDWDWDEDEDECRNSFFCDGDGDYGGSDSRPDPDFQQHLSQTDVQGYIIAGTQLLDSVKAELLKKDLPPELVKQLNETKTYLTKALGVLSYANTVNGIAVDLLNERIGYATVGTIALLAGIGISFSMASPAAVVVLSTFTAAAINWGGKYIVDNGFELGKLYSAKLSEYVQSQLDKLTLPQPNLPPHLAHCAAWGIPLVICDGGPFGPGYMIP